MKAAICFQLSALSLCLALAGCTRPPAAPTLQQRTDATLLQLTRTSATAEMMLCVRGMSQSEKRYVLDLDAGAAQSYLLDLATPEQLTCMRRMLRQCEAKFPGQCDANERPEAREP